MLGSIFAGTDLVVEPMRSAKRSLRTAEDLDPLIERIGDARYVLLGEASHGTSDYYTWRARLSQRLIEEKGFRFVAVEGDWPDCYRVNRYVKGWTDAGDSAFDVLHAFDRWPTWMWANWEMVAFVEWMRKRNEGLPDDRQAGFYGLDVYSLWESMEAVIGYLEAERPDSAALARQAFACFDQFSMDPQQYAWSTAIGLEHCEEHVVRVLQELRKHPATHEGDPDAAFDAEMNAQVAVDAERYYRTMIRGDSQSWNVRDTHMADTLDSLMRRHGPEAKCIVWEHNTHVGDARATDMQAAGMVNIGQLARERHESEGVVLVGFGCYEGSVIAGDRWGAPMEKMTAPPAIPSSWEAAMHQVGDPSFLLLMSDFDGYDGFETARGHRAIGVVYHPEHERRGNYVPTLLPQRYDAFVYVDRTDALHPLHFDPVGSKDPPETYPFAL